MEFQKSKTLLDKINALYKNISGDPRNVSSIERDLMRSYILQFYESFFEMPTVAEAVSPAPVELKAPEPRITLRKPETSSPPPPLRPQPEPPKVERTPEPEPEPPKVERTPEPAPTPPPPVERDALTVVPPPPPVHVEAPPPAPAHKALASTDPEFEELFAFKSATELSEKLSELPIADIKKAMGLNEKISTQKELFGGDGAAFDATVSTLNQLKSYNEAKDYLLRNVAVKYNWTSKEKKDKAKSFIKLVRRRY